MTDQPIVGPDGKPISVTPSEDDAPWVSLDPRFGIRMVPDPAVPDPVQQPQEDSEAERNRRMQAAANDLIVVLKANAGPFIKAMNEAAEAINRLYAAYVSGLPWYRRWPIQIKMWWRRRAWRLHL